MSANHDLLTSIYQAFNARRIDEVLAFLHPEVDWPNGMEGGRVYGRQGVRDYWTRQWGLIDPHVDPVRMADNADGRVVVDVHQVVRTMTGDVIVDQMVQHVYVIRDGLIDRMDIMPVQNTAS